MTDQQPPREEFVQSVAAQIAAWPREKRDLFIEELSRIDGRTAIQLRYTWAFWARPNQITPTLGPSFGQLVPSEWRIWLILAGRGFGKTRTGAEWIIGRVRAGARRIALVGSTFADVRDTMVLGESGIVACCPPWMTPKVSRGSGQMYWPQFDAQAKWFSAERPDRLRGPQHDTAWGDEIAAWQYGEETWDNLMMGLRLGHDPKVLATTTPRPLPLLVGNLKRQLKPGEQRRPGIIFEPDVAISKGSSYDNQSNLPQGYTRQILAMYEGTRLGRQELWAEILDDAPGALWKRELIERYRVASMPVDNDVQRIAIGVDPAITATSDSAEHGVIGGCVAECYCKGSPEPHLFVYRDSSGVYSPKAACDAIVLAYQQMRGDRVIVEVNQGGDWIESLLRAHPSGMNLPITKVHASRGKHTRAEPVVALYEQGKVHHVGSLGRLEDEMCQWVPGEGESPNRVDALTWLASALMLGEAVPEIPEDDVPLTKPRI